MHGLILETSIYVRQNQPGILVISEFFFSNYLESQIWIWLFCLNYYHWSLWFIFVTTALQLILCLVWFLNLDEGCFSSKELNCCEEIKLWEKFIFYKKQVNRRNVCSLYRKPNNFNVLRCSRRGFRLIDQIYLIKCLRIYCDRTLSHIYTRRHKEAVRYLHLLLCGVYWIKT